MTHSRKLETLEHFKKYSNHLIFIVLIGLLIGFGFSIKEELKVGNNDGTLRIQAEYDKAEKSSGYTQKIHDITVNGISIKEDDVVKNDWDYSALDIVEPYYNTGGLNQEELVIKVSEPIKTISFYYSENIHRGKFSVYIGDHLVSKIDAYSSDAETKFVTFTTPSYYGVSWGNVLWYLMLICFALVSFLFSYFHIYKEFGKKDLIKLALTSLGTSLLLYLTSQFLSENYVNIFSLSFYPRYKIFISVILAIFFTQISVITLRYFISKNTWEKDEVDDSSEVSDSIPFKNRLGKFSKGLYDRILYHLIYLLGLISPLFSYFLLQNSYSRIGNLNPTSHLYNLMVMYILFLLIVWISTSLRFSIVLIIAIGLVIGILNKIMIDVRDAPLMYYNLFQIQDGLNVANKVDFEFTQRIFQSVILGCIFLSFATFLPMKYKKTDWKKRIIISIVGIAVSVFSIPMISKSIYETAQIKLSYWRIDSTYSKNGFPLSFISYYEDSKIVKPSGYSSEKVEEILSAYPAQEEVASSQPPNIIVIQNESQADFSQLPNLNLTQDPLSFQHSLDENTVKGEIVVSSFGGGTANTEYEILTSNSLALLSSSVFPYQQLIRSERNSLVSYLDTLGYSSIAMHPQPANNYNRKNVYNYFGFDKSYFSDSEPTIFTLFDLQYERNFVSDKSLFQGIMNLYQNKEEGKPLFNFVVTMQGHGGYIDPGYPTDVQVVSQEGRTFAAENEYFTSIRKTDQAFEQLITFLKNYKEPTIVLMYGDHQPSLSDAFYDSYMDASDPSAKYKTPFLIWSNFTLPKVENTIMSPNYMVPYLMEILSQSEHPLPISSYYQFLNATRKEVPIMTTWGYWQDDQYVTQPQKLLDLLSDYHKVEYNNVVDFNTLSQYFVP